MTLRAVVPLMVLVLVPTFAAAAPTGAGDGDVIIGGELVLRFRAGAGSMTPADRADAIQARLVKFLSDPELESRHFTTAASGRDYSIKIKQELLVTVTQQDAKANKTTPQKLAESWVAHLRKLLPKLKVQPIVPKK